jgi:hypothetical protein
MWVQTLGLRAGGVVLVVWGLGLLYAAWKPGSLLGCAFVGPFRPGKPMAALSRYWAGAFGFFLIATGVASLVIS